MSEIAHSSGERSKRCDASPNLSCRTSSMMSTMHCCRACLRWKDVSSLECADRLVQSGHEMVKSGRRSDLRETFVAILDYIRRPIKEDIAPCVVGRLELRNDRRTVGTWKSGTNRFPQSTRGHATSPRVFRPVGWDRNVAGVRRTAPRPRSPVRSGHAAVPDVLRTDARLLRPRFCRRSQRPAQRRRSGTTSRTNSRNRPGRPRAPRSRTSPENFAQGVQGHRVRDRVLQLRRRVDGPHFRDQVPHLRGGVNPDLHST